jgi:tetratricopeptide (TPR) repeat protein
MKLYPLAHRGFSSLLENTQDLNLKRAALVCLAKIHTGSPDLTLPNWLPDPKVSWSESESTTLAQAFMGSESPILKTLPLPQGALPLALIDLKKRNAQKSIPTLETFLHFISTHPGSSLARYQDEAYLALGRALYSVARFKEAEMAFQKVRKTSNLEIEALSNLSWAYLADQKYDDSVGIGIQLRSGALKAAFAPEPLMVSAMALNELCLYPESIRMIRTLIKEYEESYQWLKTHPHSMNGYDLTLLALKGRSDSPRKLASEWIRNPRFLVRQLEINELIRTPSRIESTQKEAYAEQIRMSRRMNQSLSSLIESASKSKGKTLKPKVIEHYRTLKKDLRTTAGFYRASRIWKRLATAHLRELPTLRKSLVEKINTDFHQRNQKLLSQLESVRKNIDLIEVEIYNGASRDLVWKSAHPEFEASQAEWDSKKPGPNPRESWSWGRVRNSELEATEVWEDELGAIKADVQSLCKAKDKFMKLGFQPGKETP